VALRLPGKTERRLALVILVTAVVPLATALLLANWMFGYASRLWFKPEVGEQLDRGAALYKDYVAAIKTDMRHQTDAIATDELLREACKTRNGALIEVQLDQLFPRFPELVSLTISEVTLDDGGEELEHRILAERRRGRPVDGATERAQSVDRPVWEDPGKKTAIKITAMFAIDRARLDEHLGEINSTADVVAEYHNMDKSRPEIYRWVLIFFAGLLVVTMLLTAALGTLLARGVTRRINRLAAAINLVAEGDLAVRVPVTGSDELTDLARTFNRMLGEMTQSRARIEYLQRIGAWQEMAKRLAHEIKNPLTPIQLAVQECHRKYAGEDPKYRALLDTTLEVVEEEVGTLRRLVGNFSNFARLPQAELKESSLRDFLRDCSEQLAHLEDASFGTDSPDAEPIIAPNVTIAWRLPDEPLTAAIDRQMLRRVIVNLVRNAVQAIRDAKTGEGVVGNVVVSAHAEGTGTAIEVEDDGPGIPEDALARVFDPYFTTKADGTGLGLAIVKKIVVEHNGVIDAGESPSLGGARFVVHLPGPETIATTAARGRASRAELTGIEPTTPTSNR
jgi:two-component system, NtrC family, nitrogen regulation sensor histidine kinase NtrY